MLETNKELAQSFLGINGHSWKFQHNRSVDKKPQRARSWMWWCVIVWGASPTFWSWTKKMCWLFPTYNKLLDSLLPPSDKRLPNPNGHHLTIEKDVLTVFRLNCVWKALSRPQKVILKFEECTLQSFDAHCMKLLMKGTIKIFQWSFKHMPHTLAVWYLQ